MDWEKNLNIIQNFIYDDVPEKVDMIVIERIKIFIFCVK